ncbi:MAG: CHAT domain-containing protein [Longimicrobiaceae bacterium]
MRTRSSISQSFLLVGALRSVEETRGLLRETGPRYLVVTLGEPPEHYLLAARDFEGRVSGADGSARLADTALLRGMRLAPVCIGPDAGASTDRCLVFEDGMLSGVLAARHAARARVSTQGTVRSHGECASVQHVRAAMPGEVPTGKTAVLGVEVGAFGVVGVEESPLRVELPAGSELDVVVQAREGFVLQGSGAGTLVVPADGSRARAEFRLRALAPGPGQVRVYAFHEGACLGTLTLRPVVRPAPGRGRAAPARPISGTSGLGGAPAPPAADLSLLILEERKEGFPVLSIRVTARDPGLGLNLKEFGPVPLRMEPVEYFRLFFEDIEALGEGEEETGESVRQRLEGKGARLFESIFPDALQALLWELRHRIASIHVYSDEAWIPWELCRLTGVGEGGVEEGPFFCDAFEITRWIPGIARRPRLTLNHMALIMPRDTGLDGVGEEREFLRSLADDALEVHDVPARYRDVRSALGKGTFDAFHFGGHGATLNPDPDRSAIFLEESDELRPEDISGVLKNLGKAQPLVFLNSCQGARGAFTLAGVGGWAKRYLAAGAGGFIGAYWSVSDVAACGFARVFYRELRAGRSLGAAVRAARLAIREPGDPAWLAYTVYGDPSAVVRG